jgi:multiple sugar transport system permease protein
MYSMAFKSPNEYFRIPPIWWPTRFPLTHFITIINGGNIVALGNSLIITLGTLLVMAIGLPAAFSLARFKTGGENLSFFILSQRFCLCAFIIPIFLLFRFLKFTDTHHGLILLYATF